MSYPTGGQWQQQTPPPSGGGGPGQQAQQPPHYQPFLQQQQYPGQQQYNQGAVRGPYGYPPHAQPHQPPYGGAPYSGPPPPYGTPYPPYGSAQPYSVPRGAVQQSSATNSYNNSSTVTNSHEAPVLRSGNSSSAPPPSTSGGPHSYYGQQSGPTMSAHSHGSAPPVMQYGNQPHYAYAPRPPGTGGMLKSVDEMFSQDESARRAFDHADREKTGYITFQQFLQSLQNLNIQMPYHDALHRFSKLDADEDGRVCETEYLNGYLRDKFGLVPKRQ